MCQGVHCRWHFLKKHLVLHIYRLNTSELVSSSHIFTGLTWPHMAKYHVSASSRLTCTCMCMFASCCVCVCAWVRVCVHTHSLTHTRVHTHTHIHTHVCVHMYVSLDVYSDNWVTPHIHALVAGSTRQLTFVQKDLVLLRAAWNDVQEESSSTSQAHPHHAGEVERLLEKLQVCLTCIIYQHIYVFDIRVYFLCVVLCIHVYICTSYDIH